MKLQCGFDFSAEAMDVEEVDVQALTPEILWRDYVSTRKPVSIRSSACMLMENLNSGLRHLLIRFEARDGRFLASHSGKECCAESEGFITVEQCCLMERRA